MGPQPKELPLSFMYFYNFAQGLSSAMDCILENFQDSCLKRALLSVNDTMPVCSIILTSLNT